MVFRLLLLGVSSPIAFIIGIAIAFVYPARNPPAPWIVQVGQRPFRPLTRQWWQGNAPVQLIPLSSEQRQQGQQELQQLKSELSRWSDRLTLLENRLNRPLPEKNIETRLNLLEQQLFPQSATSGDDRATFLVTLPSDRLFAEDRTSLNPTQSELLDSIIADLRNYPGSIVQITAYTDNLGDGQENLELSLQQTATVYDYLYPGLGDDYNFVRVGYGETRPIVPNDSEINRQRNRRVEITID